MFYYHLPVHCTLLSTLTLLLPISFYVRKNREASSSTIFLCSFICPSPKSNKKHDYHHLVYVLICLLIYFHSTCYIFSPICSLSCHVTTIISLICKRAFVYLFFFFTFFWFLFFFFFCLKPGVCTRQVQGCVYSFSESSLQVCI